MSFTQFEKKMNIKYEYDINIFNTVYYLFGNIHFLDLLYSTA